MSIATQGHLTYTSRANRQDMANAMRNDPVVALIELVTNADDSYRAKGMADGGKITIQIGQGVHESEVITMSVLDQARGMSSDSLVAKFLTVGEENEESHETTAAGIGTRGLFGRGAKDTSIFGSLLVETVQDERFSSVEIVGRTQEYKDLVAGTPVTEEHVAAMELDRGGCGTRVTIKVDQRQALVVPKFEKLADQLAHHVALRNIVATRDVVLRDQRSNKTKRLVTYKMEGSEVARKAIEVPGYGKLVDLTLRKLDTQEPGRVDDFSRHGLVIRDSRANYENSFLSLSDRAEVGWFQGEIVAEEIDDLIREWDSFDSNVDLHVSEERRTRNPKLLVKRSREGLDHSHPYYRALAAAVEAEVRPIFDEVARTSGADKRESNELQQKLRNLNSELSRILQEVLEEADIDDDWSTGGEEDDSDFLIIPPVKRIQRGKSGTFTLQISEDVADREKIRLELDASSETFRMEGNELPLVWVEHKRKSGKLTSTAKVHANDFGSAELVMSIGSRRATAQILCEPIDDPPIPVPTALEWDKSKYSLSPMRTRNLVLRAPAEMVGETVSFERDHNFLQSTLAEKLRLHKSKEFCQLVLRVSATRLEGEGEVKAVLADQEAETVVVVREAQQPKGPQFEWEFLNENAPWRSLMFQKADQRLHITIAAKHPGIKNLIGRHSGDGFEHEESPEFLAVLAEIVAGEFADYSIGLENEEKQGKYNDPARLFVQRKKLVDRFLIPIQSILLNQ